MAIILIIKTEDGGITELPILSKIIIGRSSTSDFVIKDSKMSGSHCTIEITAREQVMFTDLGSTNGSYFNNNKTTQAFLQINDVIRIGNTFIRLEEKRLSISERRSIGVSSHMDKNEKTLPGDEPKKKDSQKQNVVIDKNIKFNKEKSIDLSNVDVVHDQEPSSGATKMLKLDRKEILIKKKKS